MDKFLSKFVITCFACELVARSAGVPLNYQGFGDNVPLFGFKPSFSIQTPVVNTHRSYNGYGNFMRPPDLYQNDYSTEPPRVTTLGRYINEKPYFSNDVRRPSTLFKINLSSPLDSQVKPNTVVSTTESAKEDLKPKYNKPTSENTIKKFRIVEVNRTTNLNSKEYKTNDTNEEVIQVDKDVIDAIFRYSTTESIHDSTTEDSTGDYTTGDYDLTTTDDLLRIPAPVVATLLG